MAALFDNNPLQTHADVQTAVRSLFAPIKDRFSPGRARVTLGYSGADYPDSTAQFEAFARPLWGLAPLTAGGGAFAHWDLYLTGLAHGVDPEHPEYWGRVGDFDQALVEMAAIGVALALVPECIWEPLDARARANLVDWLLQINHVKVNENNWLFFRILVNLGLTRVGAKHDAHASQAAFARIDSFYLGDGWYSDGRTMQRDYYVAFALHFYGLIYAKLAASRDPQRAQVLRDRAAAFAPEFIHWFAADGAALPFGRSLTYRFAQGSFWGALAFADVEVLPWGVLKGLVLRHLRWWAQQPIAHHDGTLSIGYAYPHPNMAETYNAPGSPYWALKFFVPLALPETHPFWQAEEAVLPPLPAIQPQPHAGMIICRDDAHNHVYALSSGQFLPEIRHGAEKYAKFAYSTAFGFSVPSRRRGLGAGAHDSMLALSDDGNTYRVREAPIDASLDGNVLHSQWQPWPDVVVETWLFPCPPWHIRIHRIKTARSLQSAEGGFAVARPDLALAYEQAMFHKGDTFAFAAYPHAFSGIHDMVGKREGKVIRTDPNTNVLYPRAVLPTLLGTHTAGEHWLTCAVIGLPGGGAWREYWDALPSVPEVPGLSPAERTMIYRRARSRPALRGVVKRFVRSLRKRF